MASRLAVPRSAFVAASRPATAAARRQPLMLARNAGGGPHYNEPTGYLFGEKPPPPGQKRVKESWENIWYIGMFGGMALGVVLYIYKPDDHIGSWAEKEARKRLDERGEWRYKPTTSTSNSS